MTLTAQASVEEPYIPLSTLRTLQFEWLSRLGRLSGTATLIVDSDFTIVFYDKSILETLELDPDQDMTGACMLTLAGELAARGDFGPGDPAVFMELVRSEVTKPVSPHESEPRSLNFLTPSGRRVQFRQDLEMDGYYMLSCRDVTKAYIEKHALRVALDSSNSGYLIFDLETKSFQAHGEMARQVRQDGIASRFMNNAIENLVHPDDFRKLKQKWYSAHKSRQSWSGTFRMMNSKAEKVWVKTQATPQVSESGKITGYILFYTEVTSQLRIQDDLRKAIERSERALSAKNAFLGRLSHEIRTPMNAVVGIADALVHHNADPTLNPKLELIQSSAEKIIRIVDESLEHTKLAESKVQISPRSASPRDSIEAVCSLWEQKAVENGIDLSCRVDESVPDTIVFDNHRYEQCLNNLVSNAIKFSPAGKVQVFLTTLEKAGHNNLVAVVKDSGIGMNAAQLKNLFEAYTQADSTISGRFGGTGLGMNITKQLIELMGGKISVKSSLGSGTVIALTLPIKADRREEDRRKETSGTLVDKMLEGATPAKSDYEHLNILVVDDNATNHMVVTSLLETMVSNINVAENGIEAIQALDIADANGAQYDVILMDIHMPLMDGIEATLAIRSSQKSYTNIPIIALTADPQYQQRRLCKNIGMDDALAKPVKLIDVLGALDRVFANQTTSTLAA